MLICFSFVFNIQTVLLNSGILHINTFQKDKVLYTKRDISKQDLSNNPESTR